MFLAAGDESGNHSNERYPFMAVAGYLAEIATWQAFNKQWSRQLADFGLETFHMTDFLRRKTSPYKDWSDQTCEDCIIWLIEVINTYNLRGFAVQVSRDDYSEFLSPRVKKRFAPYILLFDTALTEILRIMHSFPVEEQVTLCFHNSSLEKEARKAHKRRQGNDPQGHRFTDDLLFESADLPPIQAADILANLARNYHRGRVSGDLPITERIEKYLRRLVTRTPTSWRLISADDLRKAELGLTSRLSRRAETVRATKVKRTR